MRSEGATKHSAVVVGGGPAGLMAAEILATAGLEVAVVEHKRSVGRKLLLAGRSGLNLTNSEPIDSFLERYSVAKPVLERAIRSFDPLRLRAWAESLGEDTYIGSSGRVFPDSWRATPLLRAWIGRLSKLGVRFITGQRFVGWAAGPNGVVDPTRLLLAKPDGSVVEQTAEVTVLALGGASWPNVGSDGRWVPVLRRAGIDVADLEPSNAGVVVAWSGNFRDRFEGVPLKNVAVSHDGVRVRGDAMVTAHGLEGMPIYVHTAAVRASVGASGTATLTIDLHPDLALEQIVQRLQRRRPRESWSNWLRRSLGLAPVALSLVREVTGNQPPQDPDELAALVKALPLAVEGTAGIDRAISSAGGVRLAEVDDSFMLTKLPGVFVAGEMLDWEAPTGGYLLQATFSTAVAAAQGAVRWVTMGQ